MSIHTIEELRALGVALLHLLTLICSRLHVAVRGGKHGCARLHEELTHLHVITGGSTVQRSPVAQTFIEGAFIYTDLHRNYVVELKRYRCTDVLIWDF